MVFTVQEILNVSCMMTRLKVIQFMLPRSETGRVEKMSRVEEKESRGFYEQQLVDLEPCSLYRCTVSLPFHSSCARWEIVAEPSRVSLAAGTVDGPPRTEDWQFRMDDLKIEQRCG